MFKNAMIYKFNPGSIKAQELEEKLEPHLFVPCAPTQEKSVGWVPPRGIEHGPLAEIINRQIILCLSIESKSIPSDVLNRKVDEQCEEIERQTGRKPGKKERREIKDDARLSLLPVAFTKRVEVNVWIDNDNGLVVLDCGSQSRADEVVTALVKSIEGLALSLLNTVKYPAMFMATSLMEGDMPCSLSADRSCELKASDESKAKVKYDNHLLDIEEIRGHIKQGKMPTKLAITWDDRVSFVLTESMAIKKICLLDGTIDVGATLESDAFDVDVALFTGNLALLFKDLITALGGEVKTEEA